MLYSRIKGVAALKNIRQFLKKHTVALLLLAVALTLSTGTLWAKYAQNVTVTKGLNLTVTMETKTYTVDKNKMRDALKALKDDAPTTLKFVKGNDAALTGLTSSASIQATGSGEIGVYLSADKTTVYIAPSDGSSAVMYAPTNCSQFLYADDKVLGSRQLTEINLVNLDTSHTTNMQDMFRGNWGLLVLSFGENFDTSNVTNMQYMFYSNKKLTSLDLSGFNTSNVTTMKAMFGGCDVLSALDLRSFNTSKVTDMNWMFHWCYALTSINFGQTFYTSNVTDMGAMFTNCRTLTSLDLSSFNTAKVKEMGLMFNGCENLEVIYAGESFNTKSYSSSSTRVFYDCTKLKGGAGTTYSDSRVNKTYARIDGGTARPGYFTAKTSTSNAKTVSLDLSGLTKITASTADDVQQPGTAETPPSADAPDTKTVWIDPRGLSNITADKAA